MSSNKLVTQGELKNVIQDLGSLADNLNEHVNASMSKAHGWTGLSAIFQDSGGCLHSGPAGYPNLQRVVRIVVGNQVYYAPAQPSGGIDGFPDPVPPPYTGTASPQQADPSLDLTTGSPTPDALVTSFAAPLNASAASANNTLLAHAGSPPETVHGSLSAQPFTTVSSGGNTVGRQSVIFTYKGAQYRIICDQHLGGPPQVARVLEGFPLISAYVPGGATSYNAALTVWMDSTPSGTGNIKYSAQCTVVGSPPITYQWEYSKDNTTWIPITAIDTTYHTNDGFYFVAFNPSSTRIVYSNGRPNGSSYYAYQGTYPNGSFVHETGASPDAWSLALWQIQSGLSGTITAPSTQSTVIRIGIADGGNGGNGGTTLAYLLRLTLNNTSAGGGISHSNVLQMGSYDDT